VEPSIKRSPEVEGRVVGVSRADELQAAPYAKLRFKAKHSMNVKIKTSLKIVHQALCFWECTY